MLLALLILFSIALEPGSFLSLLFADLDLKFLNKGGECKYGSQGESPVGVCESLSLVMRKC